MDTTELGLGPEAERSPVALASPLCGEVGVGTMESGEGACAIGITGLLPNGSDSLDSVGQWPRYESLDQEQRRGSNRSSEPARAA